jgi:hypothetical protein
MKNPPPAPNPPPVPDELKKKDVSKAVEKEEPMGNGPIPGEVVGAPA